MKRHIKYLAAALVLGYSFAMAGHAALVYPPAPEGGKEMVFAHLDAKFLNVSSTNGLTVGEPCVEYTVGLNKLAAGQFLAAATPGNRVYLIIQGTNAIGAADLHVGKPGRTGAADGGTGLVFVGLNRPFQPDDPLQAVRSAGQLPQVKQGDYEVRRLNIPSLLFQAIWLHGKTDDLILPLPNTFGRWKAFQPYSADEMIKLLKPEAEKKMEAIQRLGPGAGDDP
jgi:hypothetical protein